MPEITNTSTKTSDAATQVANVVPGSPAPAQQPSLDHTKIKGRFNQYTSGYWVLALPLLGVRYFAEGINEIFEPKRIRTRFERVMDYFAEKKPAKFKKAVEELEKLNKEPDGILKEIFKKGEWWPLAVMTTMLGATSYYSARTYGDMKRQFKEPLAWEFNKDPDKVNVFDMARSKNTLVHDAVRNFESRTFVRYFIQLPFISFLLPTPFKSKYGNVADGHVADIGIVGRNYADLKLHKKLVSPKGAVNLGVGSSSAYLASDALLRKRTFFEELQNFIDNRLNHADRVGDSVTAADLMNLYDRQARYNTAVRPLPDMDTPEWGNDVKLFERMADLMNQTYGNKPNTEQANFTVPKLIYMLGMHLLKTEDPQRNMAYLEVANRYGIKAVEQVARVANGHGDLKVALEPYPDIAQKVVAETSLNVTDADNAMLKSMGIAAEPVAGKPEKSFANESLRKTRPEAPPAAQVDKLAQNSEVGTGMVVSH